MILSGRFNLKFLLNLNSHKTFDKIGETIIKKKDIKTVKTALGIRKIKTLWLLH